MVQYCTWATCAMWRTSIARMFAMKIRCPFHGQLTASIVGVMKKVFCFVAMTWRERSCATHNRSAGHDTQHHRRRRRAHYTRRHEVCGRRWSIQRKRYERKTPAGSRPAICIDIKSLRNGISTSCAIGDLLWRCRRSSSSAWSRRSVRSKPTPNAGQFGSEAMVNISLGPISCESSGLQTHSASSGSGCPQRTLTRYRRATSPARRPAVGATAYAGRGSRRRASKTSEFSHVQPSSLPFAKAAYTKYP